ncbi:hypothetical protein [Peptoniphilus asaccharolyticus]
MDLVGKEVLTQRLGDKLYSLYPVKVIQNSRDLEQFKVNDENHIIKNDHGLRNRGKSVFLTEEEVRKTIWYGLNKLKELDTENYSAIFVNFNNELNKVNIQKAEIRDEDNDKKVVVPAFYNQEFKLTFDQYKKYNEEHSTSKIFRDVEEVQNSVLEFFRKKNLIYEVEKNIELKVDKLKVGDHINTDCGLCSVLKIDKENNDYLLHHGEEFIKAHKPYIEGEKFRWSYGSYSNNIEDLIFDMSKGSSTIINIAENNYEEYIKGIFAVERGLDDTQASRAFQKYYEIDEVILNDNLNKMIDEIVYSTEKEMNKDYWIIEYQEGHDLINKDYLGKIVDKELVKELKRLDEYIRTHNKTVGEDEYGQMTDDWKGYCKFYFDHIVDGKVEEHFRMDIGDGNKVNNPYFEKLLEKNHENIDIQNVKNNLIDKFSMER